MWIFRAYLVGGGLSDQTGGHDLLMAPVLPISVSVHQCMYGH